MKQKDLDAIRQIVREELGSALNRTITVEKGPDGPGDPEKRIVTQEVSVLDFMAQYLPQIEGRLLGSQADINKMQAQVQTIGQVLMSLEQAAKVIAALSEQAKSLGVGSHSPPFMEVTHV